MNQEIAQQTAKILLDIKAVTLSPQKPYQFVSGILSPMYTDNRLLMGYPKQRRLITEFLRQTMKEKNIAADIIAGTATAGIAPAAWLAEMLELPMIYVRSKKKDYGRGNQIEGVMNQGSKVLLIEDVISTGKSSLTAAQAIRNEDGKIDACVAFFSYGFPETLPKYKEIHLTLYILTTVEILVEQAVKKGMTTEKEKEMILDWKQDPWAWTKKMKAKQSQSVDY